MARLDREASFVSLLTALLACAALGLAALIAYRLVTDFPTIFG